MKSHSERYERKQFSITKVFLIFLCSVILFWLTFFGLFSPVYDVVDLWTSQPENQAKLCILTVIVGLPLTFYYVMKRLKG